MESPLSRLESLRSAEPGPPPPDELLSSCEGGGVRKSLSVLGLPFRIGDGAPNGRCREPPSESKPPPPLPLAWRLLPRRTMSTS